MASSDSYPNGRALSSRKRVVIDDDDEDVSETETKLVTRKRAKKATTVVTSAATTSNTGLKISWSKKDELHILKGIVKYEDAKESSYDSDYGALCEYIEPSVEADFTRSQLRGKIGKLKRRFKKNLAKSAPSFVDCDDHEMFKLSMAIWAKPISQDEQIADQGEDLMPVEVTQTLEQSDYMEQAQVEHDHTLTQLVEEDQTVDHEQNQQTVEQVTQIVEQEHDETVDDEQNQQTQTMEQELDETVDDEQNQHTQTMEQEHDEIVDDEQNQHTQTMEQEHDEIVDDEQNQHTQTMEQEHDEIVDDEQNQHTQTMEQEQTTLTVEQADDLPPVENEHITETLERAGVDIGEEERITVGAEELRILQEALEELVFPTLGQVHQRFLLQNLKNLEAEEGKQLTEEWKALVVEEITLKIKIMRYSVKLGNALVSG